MGLPNPLGNILGNKKHRQETFLSLLLYPDAVDASFWHIGDKGKAVVIGAVTQDFNEDTWEARLEAADKCVSALEELTRITDVEKVILGLPGAYLTNDGDVVKQIRPYLKKITQDLGLTPIGFVSIYQSIIHRLKKDEGVPPSVILLGVTDGTVTMTLYRVGSLVKQDTFPKSGSIGEHIEKALAQVPELEILPARILIYGTRVSVQESIKRELQEYQWQMAGKFLHPPKIEVLEGDIAAVAVSYAGSAELTNTIDSDDETDTPLTDEQLPETVTPQHSPEETEKSESTEEETETVEELDSQVSEELTDEEIESGEITEEPLEEIEEISEDEHANVVPVSAETLGFTEHEVESQTEEEEDMVETVEAQEERPKKRNSLFASLPSIFSGLKRHRRQIYDETDEPQKNPMKFLFLLIPLILIVMIAYFLLTNILPKATVTIMVTPKSLEKSQSVLIDPNATSASETTIIGEKKELQVSGEKTVPATGKKTTGEAAKGEVTFINKSPVPRTIKKGTTVSAGSIDFTLDQDVAIASASETLQGITYANAKGNVTAKDIGTKGNIAAGKDFIINGISSSIATGKNEQAFSGGTSKDLIVVSRADQDDIVKKLTAELSAQAKEQFEQDTQGQTLIAGTIKTTVTNKTFNVEVGQEAKEVQGKVTVTIAGIAYKEDDIKQLMESALSKDAPSGYTLSSSKTEISLGEPKIEKSGAIRIEATGSGVAVPNINIVSLREQLVGKSITEAQELIKSQSGVGDVSIDVNAVLNKQKLPVRVNNISISLSGE